MRPAATLAKMDRVEAFLTQQVHPDSLAGAVFYLLLFLALGAVLDVSVRHLIRVARARDSQHRLDPMALGFLKGVASVAIWVAVLVAYAHLIPALRNLGTALLAGASVISIVLGLAAQSTLGNLIAGFALLLYRPFRVGDRLQVSAPTGVETGTVESLALVQAHPAARPPFSCPVVGVGRSGVELSLRCWCDDAGAALLSWLQATRAAFVRESGR